MPEYLAPGVYVEETSFRPKTIEGVSTSTAGFIGPARYGPTSGELELLTSFSDFERIYGGLDPLTYSDGTVSPNYLAHAVRAFFEEGGRRCYVTRVYDGSGGEAATSNSPPDAIQLTARFPGRAGEMRVIFTPVLSDNLLVSDPLTGSAQIRRIKERDTVYVDSADSIPSTDYYNVIREDDTLKLEDANGTVQEISNLDPTADTVKLLTVSVSIERPIIRPQRPGDRYDIPEVLQGFSLHPENSDSLAAYFATEPDSRRLQILVPFAIDLPASPADDLTGADYAQALFGNTPDQPTDPFLLEGGSDGSQPSAATYRGNNSAASKSGFYLLEDLEDISIVAAPGYSAGYNSNQNRVLAIQAHLINHCEQMRYRIAVLDTPKDLSPTGAKEFRSKIDSEYAALYYPWVRILNPITGEELLLPPSGFVAGIYARNDVERGVQKAPANEVVRLAIGFEFLINKAQQELLNPEGVNCFRFFEGRGNRLWGARTVSSDPEWKYVNLRRYFAYLERSVDKGTQWVVFESNGERLWENVRRTVQDFLLNEWKSGRLMGLTPEEAFFVRCDRSTMTQNDIDNGRLICLVGVAPLRPAEFVIFRIGQKLLETTG